MGHRRGAAKWLGWERICPEKGLHVLVEAFRLLFEIERLHAVRTGANGENAQRRREGNRLRGARDVEIAHQRRLAGEREEVFRDRGAHQTFWSARGRDAGTVASNGGHAGDRTALRPPI